LSLFFSHVSSLVLYLYLSLHDALPICLSLYICPRANKCDYMMQMNRYHVTLNDILWHNHIKCYKNKILEGWSGLNRLRILTMHKTHLGVLIFGLDDGMSSSK